MIRYPMQTPTSSLRFVERMEDGNTKRRGLQQLWVSSVLGQDDEWRDVPLTVLEMSQQPVNDEMFVVLAGLSPAALKILWVAFSNIQQAEWIEQTAAAEERFARWVASGDPADAWA